MKVRIGYGLGTHSTLDAAHFSALVDGLERLGFDSLWLSERVTGPSPDPLIGRTLAGKFKIVQLIGEGGMGAVYIGEQKLGTTSRRVAGSWPTSRDLASTGLGGTARMVPGGRPSG